MPHQLWSSNHSLLQCLQSLQTFGMARFLIFCLFLVITVVNLSEACSGSSSGSDSGGGNDRDPPQPDSPGPLDFPIGDSGATISPTYDPGSGAVGVKVTIPFRRDIGSQKATVFKLLDVNGDQFIDVCEWTKEGGKAKNFVTFLGDDDMDGDEKISWQEFPDMNV
uniref:Regeneration Associated Protein n=1 Tax=Stichopus japonicus TaxID=307972 RepID=A0A2R2WVD5_STIJA|nr:Regeneration Associated Protein [Apostichopus japonicus]